jgi:hypothetical protein
MEIRLMMTVNTYKSKKELKAAIGEPLRYEETSLFGNQYLETGTLYVARRPHLCDPKGGREFFAAVVMKDGVIKEVS